ncbi:MAG: hypothetical protein IKB34_09710 [Clostridia bacterium]|nr:hypothetical protein [Clostridia bacterium]
MKDIKILRYSSCGGDQPHDNVTLKKWGYNSDLTELTELERLLLPYLQEGYEIIQLSDISHSMDGCIIVLGKK